jgi:hypothetical protein
MFRLFHLLILAVVFTAILGIPELGAYLTSEDTQVTDHPEEQAKQAVAHRYGEGSDHFLVVFQAGTPDRILWGQRTDGEGNPVGDAFQISVPEARLEGWQPALAYSSNSDVFLLVWSDKRDLDTPVGGWTGGSDIYAQFISGPANGGDGGGQLLGGEIPLDTAGRNQRGANVTFDTEHNQFLVVWHDDTNIGINNYSWICGQRIDAGTRGLLGGEIEITDASSTAQFPAATYCPGDDSFLVVWSAVGHTTCEARRVGHDGSLVGDIFGMETGLQQVQLPSVSYAAGRNRCLVVHPLGGDVYGQIVSANRNGGDGGGQLIGSPFLLGPGDLFSQTSVDYIPDLDHWFAAWDMAAAPLELRGCWVDPDDGIVEGDCLLEHGYDIALTHGLGGRDTPWLFHRSGTGGMGRVRARQLPELLAGEDECVIERHDFLRVETESIWWNFIAAMPPSDFSVDLRIYPEVRLFSGVPLAESDYQGSGRAEIIAVNGTALAPETLNLLVEVPQYDQTTLLMEHVVADREFATGYGDLPSSLDAGGDFIEGFHLNIIEGEHYVINAIPRDDDLDVNLALFEPGTVPIAQYIGLDELVEIPVGEPRRYAYGMNPGRVETLYVVAPSTGTFGLAVWAGVGSGDYLLAIRPPDEPTTEELVKYLLGQSGIPWGGNVNGDMDGSWPIIDIADVVANIEAGR